MRLTLFPQKPPDLSAHRWRVGVLERAPLMPKPIEERFAVPQLESLQIIRWRMSDNSQMSEVETPELERLREAIEEAEAEMRAEAGAFRLLCRLAWAKLTRACCFGR